MRSNDWKSWDFEVEPFDEAKARQRQSEYHSHSGTGGRMMLSGVGYGDRSNTPVVVVEELCKKSVRIEDLFRLFGCYGDVMKIKIDNEMDKAWLEYKDSHQAKLAMIHLEACPLYGKNITVNPSPLPRINPPRGGRKGKRFHMLYKDYKRSSEHRFRFKTFMNPRNVNTPSQVLHIANLYERAEEGDLRELFKTYQQYDEEPIVEFFKTSKRMAYVAMSSVISGVNALIKLHNYPLGGAQGYPIRVSFSHKDPWSLVNSDTSC